MSSRIFEVREHVLPCQHIRGHPRATQDDQEAILHLAIKQYTPLDNPNPQPGDITIIGAHANGFPKELYEPLWEDLHARAGKNGFRIRGVWIADISNQGVSGALNEHIIGNDPHWTDHSRDLLHMVNHFRTSICRPVVGIGHSLGGVQIANLSFMHPRLFTTVLLLDPVIQSLGPKNSPSGLFPALASASRRDIWPSREEAEAAYRRNQFYQRWDPRVLACWIEYGVRDTPTALYPNEKKGSVTLTTTKHQENFNFLRPLEVSGDEDRDRTEHPDYDWTSTNHPSFYRAESEMALHRLKSLLPSAFYIFGADSAMSLPDLQEEKLSLTGSGQGGSGGKRLGRVNSVALTGVGHLVAMEAPDKCAESAADWIGKEIERWRVQEEKYLEWTKKSTIDKTTLAPEWKTRLQNYGKSFSKI